MEERLSKLRSFIDLYHQRFAGSENRHISDWDEIKEITTFFIDHEGGSPIVDFIDLANWDSVESFQFNDEERVLELVWHDFRGVDSNFSRDCFGGDLIKAEIKVSSVAVVSNQGIPVLCFKAFYRDKKELNQTFNNGCSEMKFLNSHPFSIEIGRVVKRKIEITTIPNVSCFTVSIIPDCARFISAHESKELLYSYNLAIVCEKLSNLLNSVEETSESNQEQLCAYGNAARTQFESALKVLNLKEDKKFEKDYQQLMLGDLTGVLEYAAPLDEGEFTLRNTIDTLNQCSHDAGIFIGKDDIQKSIRYIVFAIS